MTAPYNLAWTILMAAAFSLLMLPSRAEAQDARGIVRDATAKQVVAGAVVMTLDSLGMSLNRTLTDERGSYRVSLTPPARRLRVLRIGFRPGDVDVPTQSKGDVELDIALTPIPTLLEPVRVRAGAQCSTRADRIIALSLLEQARAGLLATVVARQSRPAEMIRLSYRRTLDAANERVESQQVRVDSSANVAAAFEAVQGASEFVERGFVRFGGETQAFFGPDDETLLDEDFRDGYCFHIRAPQRDRPVQVGLAFVPARPKKGRVDIDGTLWIDTSARTLQEITYEYVGLDRRLTDVHPGGVIHFRAVGNGIVIIDHWHLRLPWVDEHGVFTTTDGATFRGALRVREHGGVVASARWPDGSKWEPALGSVRIQAVDRAGNRVTQRAIRLDSTDYGGTTDTAGVVVIGRLLPGPYRAFAADTALERLGLHSRPSLAFEVDTGVRTDRTMVVPTATDYVRQTCTDGRMHIDSSGVWLLGRIVEGESESPVKSAEVRIYQREAAGWREAGDGHAKTGTDGVVPYCGGELRMHAEVRVEARRSSRDPWVSRTFDPAGAVTTFLFVLPPGRAP